MNAEMRKTYKTDAKKLHFRICGVPMHASSCFLVLHTHEGYT
ncbi:hypothetical protein EVA_16038, partial [gut metagenome]